MASGGTDLRAEANKARDEAREHGSKGTEAAKESAAQYKGAVQQEGLSALKGAEDRYETAKDYTMEKSGQAVDTASAAANDATDTVVDAKNSVAVCFSSPSFVPFVRIFLNFFICPVHCPKSRRSCLSEFEMYGLRMCIAGLFRLQRLFGDKQL